MEGIQTSRRRFSDHLVLGAAREELKAMGKSADEDFVLQASKGKAFTIATSEALCLHFDGWHIQSLMSMKEPHKLYLSYTQAMMGSLSKYCYRRFENAQITTLEISDDVLALKDQFRIPADNERFHVIRADAADYIPTLKGTSDVLLLDGFNSDGIPANLCSPRFYLACYQALDDEGLLVANLHCEDPRFHAQLRCIATIFNDNCLIGYARDCGNYVVIASRGGRKLIDDIEIDLRRLVAKTRKHLVIPHFESFSDFYREAGIAD